MRIGTHIADITVIGNQEAAVIRVDAFRKMYSFCHYPQELRLRSGIDRMPV